MSTHSRFGAFVDLQPVTPGAGSGDVVVVGAAVSRTKRSSSAGTFDSFDSFGGGRALGVYAPLRAPEGGGKGATARGTRSAGRALLPMELWVQRLRDTHPDTPAQAQDESLRTALAALVRYHQYEVPGFYGRSLEGMWGLRVRDDLELRFIPNRMAPQGTHHRTSTGCPFCSTLPPERRGIGWRDYVVLPNRYPYFSASDGHLVIAARDHVEQHTSERLLTDMIDFQRLTRGDRALTLFFNGRANNSQFHHHWQACRRSTPLQRALDSRKLGTVPLLLTAEGTVERYDNGAHLRGLLVRGRRKFVATVGAAVARAMEQDPLVGKRYNLALLDPGRAARGGDEVRLVILPRTEEVEASHWESGAATREGTAGVAACWLDDELSFMSAWDLLGEVCLEESGPPEGCDTWTYARAVVQAARGSTLPIRQLIWLPDLLSSFHSRFPPIPFATDVAGAGTVGSACSARVWQ